MPKSTPKPKKQRSLAKVKKDVWDVFSKYVRTRDCLKTTGSPDWGECISCDEPPQHPFKALQAGHYFHNWGDFNELNINAQCRSCNGFRQGNQHGYRKGLIQRYGYDVVEELEKQKDSHPGDKYTRAELEKIKRELKERIKELENE